MSGLQRFILALLPRRWGEEARAQSQAWHLCCTRCGTGRSVWDAGGIRWKARSAGKRTLVRCARCGGVQPARLEYHTGGQATQDAARP